MLPSEVEDVYMSDWWSSISLKSGVVVLDEHLIPLARRFRIFVHEMVSLVAFHIVTTFFSLSFGQFCFSCPHLLHGGQTLSLFFPLTSKLFVPNKQLLLYYTGTIQTAMNQRYFQLDLSNSRCASNVLVSADQEKQLLHVILVQHCGARNRKVTFYAKPWLIGLYAASVGEKKRPTSSPHLCDFKATIFLPFVTHFSACAMYLWTATRE